MALEFDCPSCQAMIRVPDNAAGKFGRCPQCSARIKVPKASQARRPGEELVLFPGAAAPAPVPAAPAAPVIPMVPVVPVPADDEIVFQEYDPQLEATIDPFVEAGLPPGDIAIPELSVGGPRSFSEAIVPLVDPPVLRRKPKRRSSGGVGIAVAVLLLLGAAAGGGFYWSQIPTTLAGELTADLVENPQLTPRSVPRSLVEMPEEDVAKILEDLQQNPSVLTSSLGMANVVIAGNAGGLRVSVSAGSKTSLYRVEHAAGKKLQTYLKQHAPAFEQARQENLAIAANEYFRMIRKIGDKEATVMDLAPFRDSIGLAACVNGFGSVVQAVHQRQLYPCVYEDREAVYFLLPAGVKQFQLRGKPHHEGEGHFEGKYEVKVTGTMRLPEVQDEPEQEQPAKKKLKKDEDGEMMENSEN